jgi:hypothetical protein
MSKKTSKVITEEMINELIVALSTKIDNLGTDLSHRITNIEEKLDLMIKRQNDIEERVSYRVEKNNQKFNNNMSDIDYKENIESRLILLKDKMDDKTVTKKTKKKVVNNDSGIINKRGNVIMRVYNDIVLLTGDTFDRKELIKQYGGKWDSKHTGWIVSIDKKNEIKVNLEKYTESLDYDELEEYLNEPVATVKKSVKATSSFDTCQIIDSDDD